MAEGRDSRMLQHCTGQTLQLPVDLEEHLWAAAKEEKCREWKRMSILRSLPVDYELDPFDVLLDTGA